MPTDQAGSMLFNRNLRNLTEGSGGQGSGVRGRAASPAPERVAEALFLADSSVEKKKICASTMLVLLGTRRPD